MEEASSTPRLHPPQTCSPRRHGLSCCCRAAAELVPPGSWWVQEVESEEESGDEVGEEEVGAACPAVMWGTSRLRTWGGSHGRAAPCSLAACLPAISTCKHGSKRFVVLCVPLACDQHIHTCCVIVPLICCVVVLCAPLALQANNEEEEDEVGGVGRVGVGRAPPGERACPLCTRVCWATRCAMCVPHMPACLPACLLSESPPTHPRWQGSWPIPPAPPPPPPTLAACAADAALLGLPAHRLRLLLLPCRTTSQAPRSCWRRRMTRM